MKIVKNFHIAVNALEAVIMGRIDQVLGVLPVPMTTPDGTFYMISATGDEDPPAPIVPYQTLVLPNGQPFNVARQHVPAAAADERRFKLRLVHPGRATPMPPNNPITRADGTTGFGLLRFLGSVIGPQGPVAVFIEEIDGVDA